MRPTADQRRVLLAMGATGWPVLHRDSDGRWRVGQGVAWSVTTRTVLALERAGYVEPCHPEDDARRLTVEGRCLSAQGRLLLVRWRLKVPR